MKSIKKDTIQSLKVIILALVIGLGVSMVYAFGPTANPPDNNVEAPINVGEKEQTKIGKLTIEDLFTAQSDIRVGGRFLAGNPNETSLEEGDIGVEKIASLQGGLSVQGLSLFTTDDIELGDATHQPQFRIWGLSKQATGGATSDYPQELCVDKDGYIIICPDGKAPVEEVNLSLSETSFTQTYTNTAAPTFSRTATLSWTIPAGASCTTNNQAVSPTGNATGWPVSYTINSNGSTSVTISKFKTTTFSISCTHNSNTLTDSVTYTASGIDTFTAGTTFTVPANVSSITMDVGGAGGGGGGGSDAGDPGAAGTESCVISGTTGTCTANGILRAAAGTGGGWAINGASCVGQAQVGLGGNGYTTGNVTVNPGSNGQSNGGIAPGKVGGAGGAGGISGAVTGGKGGSGFTSTATTGHCGAGGGGGGAAVSKVMSVTANSSYKVVVGAGGVAGDVGTGDQGNAGQNGKDGKVVFTW